MTGPPLADALKACALGHYATEAAYELLIATCWPDRDDFTPFITTSVSISDGTTPMAAIDWAAAVSALDAGHLPCAASERRLLRLAASLREGIPIDLQDALTGLDTTNIISVIAAVRRTAGHADGERFAEARCCR